MEVVNSFKGTETGAIPSDWSSVSLSDVCTMKSGETITADSINEYEKYPCYGGNGIRGNTARFTHEGEFALIGRQGALCGNVTFAKGMFFASEHAIVVTAKNISDVFFLYYTLGEMHLNRYSESSAQPGLSVSNLIKLRIPLPPTRTEQRAIATALSDVDALIAGLEKLIAKKRDIKQAAMQQLLTGQTRLPGFSGKWGRMRLADLASLSKDGINPAASPRSLCTHFSLPAFDAGEVPVVEEGGEIGSNKFLVPDGAVLISKLNPRIPRIWAPKEIPANAVCSTEFLVLVPRENTDREYLAAVCRSADVCYQMELHAIGTTGSHQRINPSQAMSIEVSAPLDRKEQSAIASTLSEMESEIAKLIKKLGKVRQIKQGMMQELLTGRTRLL